MLITVYDEKKGLLNLTLAVSIEYYGKAPRRLTGHKGTVLLATFADGAKYLIYGVSLNDLHLSISQNKNRTFMRKWERIGPLPDVSIDFIE